MTVILDLLVVFRPSKATVIMAKHHSHGTVGRHLKLEVVKLINTMLCAISQANRNISDV